MRTQVPPYLAVWNPKVLHVLDQDFDVWAPISLDQRSFLDRNQSRLNTCQKWHVRFINPIQKRSESGVDQKLTSLGSVISNGLISDYVEHSVEDSKVPVDMSKGQRRGLCLYIHEFLVYIALTSSRPPQTGKRINQWLDRRCRIILHTPWAVSSIVVLEDCLPNLE